MYLSADEVRTLFSRLAQRFPGAQIIFDSMSPSLGRFASRVELGPLMDAPYRWGVKHAAELETWGPGYQLMERRSVFESYRKHFGVFLRIVTRFSPGATWAHSINRLRLGGLPRTRSQSKPNSGL